MRSGWMLLASMLAVATACEQDRITTPDENGTGLSFRAGGAARAMSGTPAGGGGDILSVSFAVARADSVGGFAIIGYQRTGDNTGDLVVLQAAQEVRTFTCVDDPQPCDMGRPNAEWHGRFVAGVRDLSTSDATRYFHLVSGTLAVTQIGPARLRGTFTAVFRADDGEPGETLTVTDGVIDVPYVSDPETSAGLACLLARVGATAGSCSAVE